VPNVVRCEYPTCEAVKLPNGTYKSWLLTTDPAGVVTCTCPDVEPGVVVEILVDVAEEANCLVMLNFSWSFAAVVLKFVPEIVRLVPGAATVGVKLVIVGAPVDVVTVKLELVVNVPAGVVMLMVPFVAPDGTVVTIWFAVAELIVADVPLKLTASLLMVVLKPVPLMVTVVPTGPLVGVN
jgi:hypothetical protein